MERQKSLGSETIYHQPLLMCKRTGNSKHVEGNKSLEKQTDRYPMRLEPSHQLF